MYTYEERMRAIEVYIRNDKSTARTIRELGYPSRTMLWNWCKEYEKTGTLRNGDESHYSKYSAAQRKQAIEYYLEHGRSITRTIKALGYPKRTLMRGWVKEDIANAEKPCLAGKALIRCTQEERAQAVIRLCAKDGTAREIAADYGVTESSLYTWRKRLINEGPRFAAPRTSKKDTSQSDGSTRSQSELSDEKEALEQKVDDLKREIHRLQLEHDILEKAGELIKKGQGINLKALTNREKAVLIDALREKYRLKELLSATNMAKSSYCYQIVSINKPDKHKETRVDIKDAFIKSKESYGYRRIHSKIKKKGIHISEKVVRRLMKKQRLKVIYVNSNKKKYSSYLGEISPEVEKIINRDFSAEAPNMKWLTDITEFGIPAGKVYLSPIIDCFDGLAVSWRIGTSPDATLVNTMLDTAVSLLRENEHPIIHSDRGGHYRWPGWIERMEAASLTRSMSKKACSPDNAACEGVFGGVKNEMFYGRSWQDTSVDDFIATLDDHMRWRNEERIKMSLGGMSPMEYRKSLGLLP